MQLKNRLNNSIVCGVFDLQQVISLPITKESEIFYKRRLSTYILTFYNIGNKECDCYTWDECQSCRGSSEISTAIFKTLQFYDEQGVQSVHLFSDGCTGQNKNSILATMLLYFVNISSSIKDVSIRYFESYHGQNEGDSAHSTISSAVSRSGNIFIPSQLVPIFRLARTKQPYIVDEMQYNDFLDFKKLSKERNTLKSTSADSKEGINWLEIMEMRVEKDNPDMIFFKTSHLEEKYRSMTLSKKRNQVPLDKVIVSQLNESTIPLSTGKYQDLVSLCSGNTPVIRNENYQHFYLSLPHD